MVQSILILLKIAIAFSLLNLILGMIKPVYVLWFLDRFNRLKVLKIFGIAFIISGLLYMIVKFYFGN